MKRGRRNLLIAVGCMFLVMVIGWTAFHEREPSYKGKKLSEWRKIWRSTGYPDPVMEAIDEMGASAVPFAVRWLRYETPGWQTTIWRGMRRIGAERWCSSAWRPDDFHNEPRAFAELCFRALREKASSAVPALECMATDQDPDRRETAEAAVRALGEIGPNALAALIRIATTERGSIRSDAITCVRLLGTNGGPAVPVLVRQVTEATPIVAIYSAWALGQLQLDPDKCLPALMGQIHNADPDVRFAMVSAIGMFGNGGRKAVSSLLDSLQDSDDRVRAETTNALQKVAPEMLTNGVAR